MAAFLQGESLAPVAGNKGAHRRLVQARDFQVEVRQIAAALVDEQLRVQATHDPLWLERAVTLTEAMVARFFAEARAVVDELVELVEGGHEIGPGTVDAVLGALDQAEDIRDVFDDVVWRHRGKKIAPKTVITVLSAGPGRRSRGHRPP